MTREHKQYALIVVLSLVLYAVWPSSGETVPEPEEWATDAVVATNASVSAATSAKKPVSDGQAEPPRVSTPNSRTGDSVAGEATETPVPMQHWDYDEIVTRDPFSTRVEEIAVTQAKENVSAIYFTRSHVEKKIPSSPASSNASAVLGKRVVAPGHTLPGGRRILTIHPEGIEIANH